MVCIARSELARLRKGIGIWIICVFVSSNSAWDVIGVEKWYVRIVEEDDDELNTLGSDVTVAHGHLAR